MRQILAAAVLCLAAGGAVADDIAAMEEIDKIFFCPEAFNSDIARQKAAGLFFDTLAKFKPDATILDLTRVRMFFLRKYGCTVTLRNLERNLH